MQTRLGVGRIDPSFQLKEVHVVPENGIFTVYLVLQTDKGEAEKTTRPEHVPERVCAVDLGVNNLMAVSNNCGLPCILYRGGILKSVNHLYNRKVSAIMSEQTKGTDRKFQATEEYCRVTLRRNNQVSDFMHKTARHFIHWCVENRIDTIVAGVNRSWK
ncbi:MAG: transposase [Oscillospiraceae bacterium]